MSASQKEFANLADILLFVCAVDDFLTTDWYLYAIEIVNRNNNEYNYDDDTIMTKIMLKVSTQLWRGTSFHLMPNASATVYHILTLTNCYVTQISSTLGKLFFFQLIFFLVDEMSFLTLAFWSIWWLTQFSFKGPLFLTFEITDMYLGINLILCLILICFMNVFLSLKILQVVN